MSLRTEGWVTYFPNPQALKGQERERWLILPLLTNESLAHILLEHPFSDSTKFPVLNPCPTIAFSTSSSRCPQISLVHCATPCYAVNRKQIHHTAEVKITLVSQFIVHYHSSFSILDHFLRVELKKKKKISLFFI